MQESGLMQKWRTRWWAPASGCRPTGGPTAIWQTMSLESLAGAILVLASAIGASLIALGLEVFLARSRRGRVRKTIERQQESCNDKP